MQLHAVKSLPISARVSRLPVLFVPALFISSCQLATCFVSAIYFSTRYAVYIKQQNVFFPESTKAIYPESLPSN